MRLTDFDRVDAGRDAKFTAVVDDAASPEQFEVTVAGPTKVLERMFAEATIDLAVDSAQGAERLRTEFDAAHPEHRRSMWETAALGDLDGLLKPRPPAAERASSVFASARPVSGDGTPFAFSISGFFVPTAVSFFFFGSWVLSAFASVRPASGDQDLFLRMFSPTGAIVSSGTNGGVATDVVVFSLPIFPFVPVFQVFGFAGGVCSNLLAVGA
jgi:hypothetical protein